MLFCSVQLFGILGCGETASVLPAVSLLVFFTSEEESKILVFGHEIHLRKRWLALLFLSGLSVKGAMNRHNCT